MHRGLVVGVDALVVNGVVQLDDVALALDGVGQEDRRGVEVGERFDQEGLAVAGLAVKQQGIGGTDRRARSATGCAR